MHLELQDGVVALGLLGAVAALLALAPALRIPYPILLVLGGLAIGVIPGMPNFELQPELVFFGVLPPLLYSAAFFTSLRDLRANVRPIGLLAIGLVVDDDRRRRGRGTRARRRADLAQRLRARRDRLADRPDRGDRDRPPARRSAKARHDRRGREPRQRRHRPGPVPRRRRRGRDRFLLGAAHRRALRRAARAAASRSGSPSAGSYDRSAAGSTTRRRRSRSRC